MKSIQGKVIALNTDKTAKVSVVRLWQHPVYKKSVKRNKNYACHFEDLKINIGDDVIISDCAPVSKTRKFKVIAKVKGIK